MKSPFLIFTICFLFVISPGYSQNTKNNRTEPAHSINKTLYFRDKVKYENPVTGKTNEYVIISKGGISFKVSNVSDGSATSFSHSQKITQTLFTQNKKDTIELIFYANDEKIPVAVNESGASVIVYYPLSLYEEISQRIDRNLSAKKNIGLKISIQPDGYREAEMVFYY